MPSTLAPDLTPRRAAGLEVRAVPEGFVVYDPSRDRLHFLNGTAAFVLESCDGATPVAELAALLASAFQLQADPVAEVDGCVRRLLAEGLLLGPAPQTPDESV